jgi:hypothetical protein
MKLQIVEKILYKKSFKKLSKHYKNISNDIDKFLNSINSKDDLGIIFKVRIKNSKFNRK